MDGAMIEMLRPHLDPLLRPCKTQALRHGGLYRVNDHTYGQVSPCPSSDHHQLDLSTTYHCLYYYIRLSRPFAATVTSS